MITATYTCTRCGQKFPDVPLVGGAVTMPAGWGRVGVEHGDVRELCVICHEALTEFLEPIEPMPQRIAANDPCPGCGTKQPRLPGWNECTCGAHFMVSGP